MMRFALEEMNRIDEYDRGDLPTMVVGRLNQDAIKFKFQLH